MSDTSTTDVSWRYNQHTSVIFDKIMDICDSGVLRSDHRSRIGIDNLGSLTVDSFVIPHDLLELFFNRAYAIKVVNTTHSNIFPFIGTKYEIIVGGRTVSFIEHKDGFQELYLDDQLHCNNGPARFNNKDIIREYYIEGKLHREDGAAQETESRSIYALDGDELSLLDFIINNPLTDIEHGYRGHGEYTVYRWHDYVVVKCLDGTVVLLKEHIGKPDIDNLLVQLVSVRLDNYKVLYYQKTGNVVDPLIKIIRSLGTWSKNKYNSCEEFLNQSDNSETLISYSNDTHRLNLHSTVFNEDLNLDIDLGYEYDIPEGLFPDITIKKDLYGRNHCSTGPAIINQNGEKEYYLHGTRLIKSDFNSAKYDTNDGSFYWTDHNGKLHNRSWTPAKILPSGEVNYYHHGLLHSNTFPAVEIPGDGFDLGVYYLYGNEVSPKEFNNYNIKEQEITFVRDGKLHRDDGPARIIFKEDGECIKEFYASGTLHNDSGPAIISTFGGFEYIKNGERHRKGLPALYDPNLKKIAFYEHGVFHRLDGPAVIYDIDYKRKYESWNRGIKLGSYSSSVIVESLETLIKQGLSKMAVPRLKFKTDKLGIPSLKDNNKTEKGEKMAVKFIRPGSPKSNVESTRKTQVVSGIEVGMKKETIKITSDKAAATIAGYLPMSDSLAMQRLVQLGILLTSAEMVERLPDNVGDKVGLNKTRRDAFGGLSRFVSGEILGRDAVKIVTELAPTLLDALRQLSTSDITEAAGQIVSEEVKQEVVAG